MTTSDCISIVSIVINSGLTIWIAFTLQKGLTNQRYFKSHLIQEIKDVKLEYKSFLQELSSGKLYPSSIIPWFKLMNIKIQNLSNLISNEYDKCSSNKFNHLNDYQTNLRKTVTELDEFINNYKLNTLINLENNSLEAIIVFQQNNQSAFNNLIKKVNSSK